MNLNGDEKRIQRLFGEMRNDDERRAPQFAGFLQRANSRTARSRNGTRRFGLAAAMLCVAVLIAAVIVVRHPKTETRNEPDDRVAVSEGPTESSATVGANKPRVGATKATPVKPIIKHVRHRRTSNELTLAVKSLFAWQSPTASLLKAPGEEMLKSLPRLGESLQTVKSLSPDQFN